MAVIRRKPCSIMKGEVEVKPTLKNIQFKKITEELKLPMYNNVDFDSEVVGLITDCDVATHNSDYVRVVVTLFYDENGSTYEFLYNMKKQSAYYLHKFASLFDEYKSTLNLYSIVGKTFIGKLNKNKGYLNLVGIDSISKEDFAAVLKRFKKDRECDCSDEEYGFEDGDEHDL